LHTLVINNLGSTAPLSRGVASLKQLSRLVLLNVFVPNLTLDSLPRLQSLFLTDVEISEPSLFWRQSSNLCSSVQVLDSSARGAEQLRSLRSLDASFRHGLDLEVLAQFPPDLRSLIMPLDWELAIVSSSTIHRLTVFSALQVLSIALGDTNSLRRTTLSFPALRHLTLSVRRDLAELVCWLVCWTVPRLENLQLEGGHRYAVEPSWDYLPPGVVNLDVDWPLTAELLVDVKRRPTLRSLGVKCVPDDLLSETQTLPVSLFIDRDWL
jgi:hypothetical protein